MPARVLAPSLMREAGGRLTSLLGLPSREQDTGVGCRSRRARREPEGLANFHELEFGFSLS